MTLSKTDSVDGMSAVKPGIRERNRARVQAELLTAARSELARAGAASLSVRAVARQMGMAPSALFRYITGRDELLTLLIVDAYNSLADEVEPKEQAISRELLRERWRALAHGMRSWALRNPHEWALLYGSPVPEYSAPAEMTNEPGMRLTNVLLQIGFDLARTGKGPKPLGEGADAEAKRAVKHIAVETDMQAVLTTHGILAWVTILGAISAEVFEQLGTNLGEADALFDYAVRAAEQLLFGSVRG